MAPADEVEIVRVSQGTAHVLDAVADDVFDDEIATSRLATVLASDLLVVVAVNEGLVVGQVQAIVQHHVDGPPQLYVDNLGVAPAFRRRGIARALLGEVVAWSSEFGCEETWIVTDVDNRAAKAFYRAAGAQQSTVSLYSITHRDERCSDR